MTNGTKEFSLDHIVRRDRCSRCRGEAKDWKCTECGQTSTNHNPLHKCGGHKLQPKCVGCNEAENNCKCGAQKS